MNILYASDDNFARVAGVSILSLFESNKDAEEINVYLIDNNISKQNKTRLIEIQKRYQRKVVFLDAPDVEQMSGTALHNKNSRYSLATFSRLFISSILPTDMEKIIYIDCDTVIRKSLKELWETEQGDDVISAVVARILPPRWRLYYRKSKMIRRWDKHIISGVMLINLKLWRVFNVEEKYVKYLTLIEGKVTHEEGVLNDVLKYFREEIDPVYNCIPSYARIDGYPLPSGSIPTREIIDDPAIVHYIGGITKLIKKWAAGKTHSLGELWLKYYHMSPWMNEPLSEEPLCFDVHNEVKNKKMRKAILNTAEKKCKPLFIIITFSSRIIRETSIWILWIYKSIKHAIWFRYRLIKTGIKTEDFRLHKKDSER